MKRDIGCLILRNGVWHVRWKYEKVQHQKSTGCTDRDEAEAKAAEIVAPFLARRHQDVAAALAGRVEAAGRAVVEATPPLAVADLWQAYEHSTSRPDAGEDTMRMYRAQVGRFVRWVAATVPHVREVRVAAERVGRVGTRGRVERVAGAQVSVGEGAEGKGDGAGGEAQGDEQPGASQGRVRNRGAKRRGRAVAGAK